MRKTNLYLVKMDCLQSRRVYLGVGECNEFITVIKRKDSSEFTLDFLDKNLTQIFYLFLPKKLEFILVKEFIRE